MRLPVADMSAAHVGDIYRMGRKLYRVAEIGESRVGPDTFLEPCIGFHQVEKTGHGYVRVDRGGKDGKGWHSCGHTSRMAEFMELVERRQ